MGPTALGNGGVSSQQGLRAPAKAGADSGAEPGARDPESADPSKGSWSSVEVGILKRELRRLGHQWSKIQVGQHEGFAAGAFP